jgi:hypothetical protein
MNPEAKDIKNEQKPPQALPDAPQLTGVIDPEVVQAEGKHFIAKVDRTTSQDMLPAFMVRGIFTRSTTLPAKAEIIEKATREKGHMLSFQERREALTKAGEYKDGNYIFRDFGTHCIGFSSKLYIDYIEKTETELKQELLEDVLFPELNRPIEEALKKLKLFKIAHNLAYYILCECYRQGVTENVLLPKQQTIEALGYSVSDKQIYSDIEDALFSLRWLDYLFFDYSYTGKARTPNKERGSMAGNFIYNIKRTPKDFTISVNPNFVGCVSSLFKDEKRSKKKRRELFSRGYFDFPTRLLALVKGYSSTANSLAHFLVRERGNRHLNSNGIKVIAYRVDYYIEKLRIQHSRANRKYKEFIEALKEIEFIEKTDPGIEYLEQGKPAKMMKELLKIHLKRSTRAFDKQIEAIIDSRRPKNTLPEAPETGEPGEKK